MNGLRGKEEEPASSDLTLKCLVAWPIGILTKLGRVVKRRIRLGGIDGHRSHRYEWRGSADSRAGVPSCAEPDAHCAHRLNRALEDDLPLMVCSLNLLTRHRLELASSHGKA